MAADLSRLGLPRGRVVLVHSSLRRIRPAPPGPATLLAALVDTLGPEVTIVVPVHTANNSVTSPAFRAAAARSSPEAAEAAIVGFDPALTPSFGMGSFAEHVRRTSGAVRSGHPQVSFAALGPAAEDLMARHDLDCHLGERSPIGRLYEQDADILMAGVGYDSCTGLHLAEYRLPGDPPVKSYRCYLRDGDSRARLEFTGVDLDDSDFARIGRSMDEQPFVHTGWLGGARTRVIPLRSAVDYTVTWMKDNRGR